MVHLSLVMHFLKKLSFETCFLMILKYDRPCFLNQQVLPHPCKVNDVDITNEIIAVGQVDGGVAIWKLKDGQFKHDQLLWGHDGQSVILIKFHPNGDLLATGSEVNDGHCMGMGIVNIWTLSTSTVIQTVPFDSQEGKFSRFQN
jgi:WD40 repeat protein